MPFYLPGRASHSARLAKRNMILGRGNTPCSRLARRNCGRRAGGRAQWKIIESRKRVTVGEARGLVRDSDHQVVRFRTERGAVVLLAKSQDAIDDRVWTGPGSGATRIALDIQLRTHLRPIADSPR